MPRMPQSYARHVLLLHSCTAPPAQDPPKLKDTCSCTWLYVTGVNKLPGAQAAACLPHHDPKDFRELVPTLPPEGLN